MIIATLAALALLQESEMKPSPPAFQIAIRNPAAVAPYASVRHLDENPFFLRPFTATLKGPSGQEDFDQPFVKTWVLGGSSSWLSGGPRIYTTSGTRAAFEDKLPAEASITDFGGLMSDGQNLFWHEDQGRFCVASIGGVRFTRRGLLLVFDRCRKALDDMDSGKYDCRITVFPRVLQNQTLRQAIARSAAAASQRRDGESASVYQLRRSLLDYQNTLHSRFFDDCERVELDVTRTEKKFDLSLRIRFRSKSPFAEFTSRLTRESIGTISLEALEPNVRTAVIGYLPVFETKKSGNRLRFQLVYKKSGLYLESQMRDTPAAIAAAARAGGTMRSKTFGKIQIDQVGPHAVLSTNGLDPGRTLVALNDAPEKSPRHFLSAVVRVPAGLGVPSMQSKQSVVSVSGYCVSGREICFTARGLTRPELVYLACEAIVTTAYQIAEACPLDEDKGR